MSAINKKTLSKEERLCSRTLIENLFLGQHQVKKAWPVKAVYKVVDKDDECSPQVEILVSVSKHSFKRAVKRNRVKRQLREAYRQHQYLLLEALAAHPQQKMLLAFIWMDSKLHATPKVDVAVTELLEQVATGLKHSSAEQDHLVGEKA